MKSKKHIAHADQNTQDGGYQGYYNERHCSRACWKREKVQLAAPLFSSPPSVSACSARSLIMKVKLLPSGGSDFF